MSEEHITAGTCPSCGERVPSSWTKCLHCGISLDSPLPPPRGSSQPGAGRAEEAFGEAGKLPRLASRKSYQPYDDEPPPAPPLNRYASGWSMALAAMVLIGLCMTVDGISLIHGAIKQATGGFAVGAADQLGGEMGELTPSDVIDMGIGCSQLSLLVITAIFFLIWFYRAYENLKPLGAERLQYSSGWAVGSWFVPILNLFRPYQIAQEIWKKSDPDVEDESGNFRPRVGSGSGLIGFWWAMWIVGAIVGQISFRAALAAETRQALQAVNVIGMVADAISIVTGMLAILVIRGITERQTARFTAIDRMYPQAD